MSNEIQSGTYAVMTQEAILSAIKAELKLSDTPDQDIYFTRLINEAVLHTDNLSLLKKCVKTLSVTDNVATLPCGFVRMMALALGECQCPQAIYVSLPFIRQCGASTSTQGVYASLGAYEIQNNHIVFHSTFFYNGAGLCGCTSDVSVTPITQCTIAYLGMNVDDEGMYKIYTRYERGIIAYVVYKYMRQNFKEYPRDIREDYRREWEAQKRFIKGVDFQNNFRDNKWEVAEWANALIGTKNFNPDF